MTKNLLPHVSPINQTIEAPCKNPKLSVAERKLLKRPDIEFLVREDIPGNFYYPADPQGPMFQDCYFEADDNYEGVFATKSPLKIFFEITRTCNLKCAGCYIPDMMGDNMDIEKVKSIIDDASESGVLSIQLLGGEPTLHPHFVEICKYIKQKGISVESVSNGVRLSNKGYVEKLSGLVDYLAISVDGSEEVHNEFRGSPKSYEKAMQAFNNLVEAGFNTEILMTVSKLNIGDIDKVFDAIGRDSKRFYLKIMHKSDSMSDELKKISLNIEDIKYIKNKADSLGIGIQAPVAEFGQEGSAAFFGCPGGIITAIIDTSGDVHKCLYIRDEKEVLGNVFEKNFTDIWLDIKKRAEDAMGSACNSCSLKSACGGLCTLCKTEQRYY